jgi:hypothetical protein
VIAERDRPASGFGIVARSKDAPHPQDLFSTAQVLVEAAVRMSRLLWPNQDAAWSKARLKWAQDRGKALCTIADPINRSTSPLGFNKVRNRLEHFDEYMDQHLLARSKPNSPPVAVFDLCVGTRTTFQRFQHQILLRFIDTDTPPTLIVTDVELELQPLIDEIGRVEGVAVAWLIAHPRA